jgi:hypothetical protein
VLSGWIRPPKKRRPKVSANSETKRIENSTGRDFRRHGAGKHLSFQSSAHRSNIGVIAERLLKPILDDRPQPSHTLLAMPASQFPGFF